MSQPHVSDTWNHGDLYEQYVGRWSRVVAPRFLAWLDLPTGRRWLDVGCGTGALCDAIADHCAPSQVVGVEPSEGFLKVARENLGDRAVLHQGDAARIPLTDEAVDVVVSALVLNFVPSPHAALAEMERVTGGGGTIAAYVWDYAGKMDFMRAFWDAAADLDPRAGPLDEGVRFPLCRREALAELFTGAGLKNVDVTGIEIETPFASFEEYWQPFLGGQGPAPAYAMSLDQAARERLRECVQDRLPVGPGGSIVLTARAWAVRGTIAAT